ncbi:MAG: hypothetical protein IAI50_07240 [Candidatus Eremiobacteraeota bacterium]|nr:hypothetical protein [Candidatus Eremiobacteraeota bacterium]
MGAGARAEVTSLDGLDAPIVRINLRQGDVTIRTWDRPTVMIDGDPSLVVQRNKTNQRGAPYAGPVAQIQGPSPEGPASLAAESFLITSVPEGAREAILVKSAPGEGGPPTPVTVTVPNASVYVFAHTNFGTLDVHDYRGGTLFASVARGRVTLENVGGAVFAQSARGPVTVIDSSFDRLRTRSLTGNITFERCHAHQIEATSVNGSIVYDGGTFAPGLARFESTHGDVAIGTTAGAEIGAHAAGNGRVYTNFSHPVRIDGRDGQMNAVVSGGGPVVNATSQSGNVFLYDGSLRSRGTMSPEWSSPLGALQRPGVQARAQNQQYYAPQRDTQARPNPSQQGSAAPRKFGRRRKYDQAQGQTQMQDLGPRGER